MYIYYIRNVFSYKCRLLPIYLFGLLNDQHRNIRPCVDVIRYCIFYINRIGIHFNIKQIKTLTHLSFYREIIIELTYTKLKFKLRQESCPSDRWIVRLSVIKMPLSKALVERFTTIINAFQPRTVYDIVMNWKGSDFESQSLRQNDPVVKRVLL